MAAYEMSAIVFIKKEPIPRGTVLLGLIAMGAIGYVAEASCFFGALQYWLDGIPGNGFWSHVYFSGITFLTIGYGDLVPVEPWPRALAVIEGVVGITVLGMLIASWTKKIMYR